MVRAADSGANEALEAWLRGVLADPSLRLVALAPLSGGAIQENWLVGVETGSGGREFVLRKDAPARIASSLSREDEFSVLRLAAAAGVAVPEPVAFCRDPGVVGGPFALMERCPGVALGPRVVRDVTLGGDRIALVERLGAELARLHRIVPPVDGLAFLGAPPGDPSRAEVERLRCRLDHLRLARPALEWGLRWAERHAPLPGGPALLHGDCRTGNYLVDGRGLVAILDWEFAGWGDPMADLGWFCAECWRFGRPDLEAGGVAPREALYRGYEAAGGRVDHAAVRYWEVVAHLRWAVVALEQGARHVSGAEPSLELALTGRMAAELELSVLRMTAPRAWGAGHG